MSKNCRFDCFKCPYDDCIADIAERDPEIHRRYYQNHKEEIRAKQKRRYEKLKAAGICVTCGQRPIAKGSTVRCVECLARYRQRINEHNRKKGIVPRASMNGVDWCRMCGKKKPVEGYQHCEECLEKVRATAAYMRKFIDRGAE